MRERLRLSKCASILLALGLCMYAYNAHARAWTQKKRSSYSMQSIGLKREERAATTVVYDADNSMSLRRSTLGFIAETYLEHGLLDDLTLEMKVSNMLVREGISVAIKQGGSQYSVSNTLSYNRLLLCGGIVKNIILQEGASTSIFWNVTPGEYIISGGKGSRYYSKNWNVEAGISYGNHFGLEEAFADNYYELSSVLRYLPKVKKLQANADIKFGFKLREKFTIGAGLYNTFHRRQEKYHPYLERFTEALDSVIQSQDVANSYKSTLTSFLASSSASTTHQLQLSIGHIMPKNKEVQLSLFFEPLKGVKTGTAMISIVKRF